MPTPHSPTRSSPSTRSSSNSHAPASFPTSSPSSRASPPPHRSPLSPPSSAPTASPENPSPPSASSSNSNPSASVPSTPSSTRSSRTNDTVWHTPCLKVPPKNSGLYRTLLAATFCSRLCVRGTRLMSRLGFWMK
ncbi:hypothetical protein GLYMA_18G180202v4 [Glycine max]|nr:hypothetical protein GLYMA_18G180202v4 [Glycine max]KAH1154998.1 hypothetical protein GYH30_050339 [Glycine max]